VIKDILENMATLSGLMNKLATYDYNTATIGIAIKKIYRFACERLSMRE